MKYTIRPIETRYAGVAFRSRLEAKWAAMFDLLGWRWSYEPVDFNGWVPDFSIHAECLTYVEVKPVVSFPADVAEKIDASGCDTEVLILGQECPVHLDWGSIAVGWLRERQADESFPMSWGEGWAESLFTKTPGGQIGFAHSIGSYACRITGEWDGDHYLHHDPSDVTMLWREAGNRTRWNPD